MRSLPLIAAAVVCAGMVPSVVMLGLARELHIAKVDDRPYLVSSAIDTDRQALAALRAKGFRYALVVDGAHVVATMSGGLPGDAVIVLQRPDDAGADMRVAWTTPSQPLVLSPGHPGRWHVRLDGTVDGVPARLVETAVDIGN